MIETKYVVHMESKETIEIMENPDVPGCTNIVFTSVYGEGKDSRAVITVADKDLPDLITALQKRSDDVLE